MDFNGCFMRNRAKFTKYLNKNQNFLEKLLEVIYNSFISESISFFEIIYSSSFNTFSSLRAPPFYC